MCLVYEYRKVELWTAHGHNKSKMTTPQICSIDGNIGAGKSTIIEALNFALFSNSFRNMTKGELRNTANKGKLKVELEFEREDAKSAR